MEKILYKSSDGISFVTLNRPDVFNAMDQEMLQQLLTVIKQIEESPDRIVIVHGAGAAFSAGGDVAMMAKEELQNNMEHMMDLINEIVIRWYQLRKFTIAAVHGSAAGLGLSFALNTDLIIAHEKTKLGMLFAGVGFMPDGGGHFFLQDKLGIHQAKKFIWSMEQINALEAKKFGLIDMVTEDDVVEKAKVNARKFNTLPFEALMATKQAYCETQLSKLKQLLEIEKREQMKLSKLENHQEGVAAFLEKRQPHFK